MKHIGKKLIGLLCAVTVLCTMFVLPAAAISGGGGKGSGSIHAWGCDMSFYNTQGSTNFGLVDYAKMKADGCNFVILRIGYEGSVSRANTLDTSFVKLYNMARAAGMHVGVYFYALAKTRAEAVEDAQWCIDIFKQYDMYFDYPIYYDVEDPGEPGVRVSHESLSSAETTALCLGWAETLANAGYFPGVYAGYYVLADLQSSYTNNYDTWIASVLSATNGSQYNPWTDKTSFRSSYGMWQYKWYNQGGTQVYDGATWKDQYGYPLDCNVAFKDYPTIMQTYGYNNAVTKHTITFESNGGTAVDPVRVTDGKTLTAPVSPTRWGFDFAGWYCDPELTSPYDFNTPVPYGFTLYAKWNDAYWGANTNLMPNSQQLQLNEYNSAGEKIWPYWNNDAYGSVTLYNGVTEEWSWPSAQMTYENSFDANHDSYVYVKKEGNALFNASIQYMANDGNLYSVKLSELAGQGQNDLAAGYLEEFFNIGQFVKNMGHMPADGNLKFTKVTYWVIGAPDSYVKLYDMKLTDRFDVAAGYESLYDKNVQQISGSGSYVYDNGTLTLKAETADGYQVRFNPNKTFNPSELSQLVADVTSTAPYNVTLEVTTDNGTVNVEWRNEFFDRFELSTPPAVLPAGSFNGAMNMIGFYQWNGGIPAQSTVKSVTVTLAGQGTLTFKGLQLSRKDTVTYITDGEYASGSLSGDAPVEITSAKFVVSDDMVCGVEVGTTLAELLAGIDQKGVVSVYDQNGTKLTGVAPLTSGMTVKLEVNGTTVREYTLALNGDVNGDGKATTVDARLVIGALLTTSTPTATLNEWQQSAANFDGNDVVNTADARALLLSVLM